MAITVNDNFQSNSPKSNDNKYLKNGTVPYTSVSDVNTTISSAYRHKGLTVLIDIGSGVLREYHYKLGIADVDLVAKVSDNVLTGTSSSLPTTVSSLGFPTDIGGTLQEVAAGPTIDNIFHWSIGGKTYKRIIDGPYRVAWANIVPGSNKATELQALVNSGVKEIVFDNGDITITSSTITVPAGVMLTYKPGSRTIGTGTISGGIINAGDNQSLIDNNLTFHPAGSTKEYYSAKWWNVIGDGVAIDNIQIQKILDFISTFFSTRIKPIYFPGGDYLFHKGVALYRFSAGEYQQCTIQLKGEFPIQSGVSSKFTRFLTPTLTDEMADQFILGLQKVRTVVLENIWFNGPYTRPVAFQLVDICNNDASHWNQTTPILIKDTQWSPCTLLNIDPFTSADPGDGGYPGFEALYQGSATTSGSSQIVVKGCRFDQAPVLIACSINGTTQQAEIIKFEDCSFGWGKVGYATGQAQTKENVFNNCRFWEPIRTLFDGTHYGDGDGAPPYVTQLNIAGGVYQMVDFGSPFSFFGDQIFAELLYKVGKIGDAATTSALSDCQLDFTIGTDYNVRSQDCIVEGTMHFVNCVLRYYGPESRLRLAGPASTITMTNGTVNHLPIMSIGSDSIISDLQNVQTYNSTGLATLNNNRTSQGTKSSFASTAGRVMSQGFKFNYAVGQEGMYEFDYQHSQQESYVFLQNAVVTCDTPTVGKASLTLTTANAARLKVNDYLVTDGTASYDLLDGGLDNSPTLGRILTVDTGTGVVTLDQVSISVNDGASGATSSIPIYLNFVNEFSNVIACDMDSTTVLKKVECLDDLFPAAGARLQHPYIPVGTYVVSVNNSGTPGASTITLSSAVTATAADQTIINGNPVVKLFANYNWSVSGVYPLIGGAEIRTTRGTQYSEQSERQYIITTKISAENASRPINFGGTFDGAQRISIAKLQQMIGYPNQFYWLSDAGKEGFFKYDSTDTTTADNAATVIVGLSSSRFKRIIEDNFYSAKWFGQANIWFADTATVVSSITAAHRFKGLTVQVDVAGTPTEYWWSAGTADGDLIVKGASSGITGALTSGRIPVASGTTTVADSLLRATSTQLGIGGTPAAGFSLDNQLGHFRTDYYESATKVGNLYTDITGGNNLRLVVESEGTAALTSELVYYRSSATDRASVIVDTGTAEIRHHAGAGGYFQTFYASNAEKMRITATGVGINKTPTKALDVLGGVLFTDAAAAGFVVDGYATVSYTGGTNFNIEGDLKIARNGVTTTFAIEVSGTTRYATIVDPGTGEIRHHAGAGGYFQTFYANNAEQARLTATGLGVGGTAAAKLHVFGSVRLDLGSDASFDTLYRGASDILVRLPNGTTGQSLIATTSAAPSWGIPIKVIEAKASTPYNITTGDNGKIFTNEGAAADITFNLPTAATGLTYTFYVQETTGAISLFVVANTGDTIRIEGSQSAAAGNIEGINEGQTVTLVAINSTEWVAINGTLLSAWVVT